MLSPHRHAKMYSMYEYENEPSRGFEDEMYRYEHDDGLFYYPFYDYEALYDYEPLYDYEETMRNRKRTPKKKGGGILKFTLKCGLLGALGYTIFNYSDTKVFKYSLIAFMWIFV